uniref:SFRICE_040349 n=1 Tax=Spodoptera frugiperda TaxID=7108 RepID=A0A2H1WXA5_SPOFR
MADKLVKRRSSMRAKLTIFSTYLNVLNSCDNLSNLQIIELEARFDKFNALYTEFDKLQTEIEVSSDNPEEAYATRDEFEQPYYSLVALARSLLLESNGKSQGRDSKDSVPEKHSLSLEERYTEFDIGVTLQ